MLRFPVTKLIKGFKIELDLVFGWLCKV